MKKFHEDKWWTVSCDQTGEHQEVWFGNSPPSDPKEGSAWFKIDTQESFLFSNGKYVLEVD